MYDEQSEPQTILECDDDIARLKDEIAEMNSQISLHAKGLFPADDPGWVRRALARKSHLLRELRDVQSIKRDLLQQIEDARKAERDKKQAEQAARVANIEQLIAANRRSKRRFQALHDWAWDQFPDHRDAIADLVRKADGPDETTLTTGG